MRSYGAVECTGYGCDEQEALKNLKMQVFECIKKLVEIDYNDFEIKKKD